MLTVRVSSKGQIVIPKPIRESLGLRQGAELTVEVEQQRIVLSKPARRDWRRWAGRFPKSGMLTAHEAEHREEVLRDAQGA